ncbi:MAG: 50S ribosomal protein L19 [Candidatus Moranbacteria bacterium]|nr:50S ribosomal protein L19 [Candidatus Moranbacteria bacterium]
MVKILNEIRAGDKVRVNRKVKEGDKERIQVIEGTVIARKHGNEKGATITVRKMASGVGVEFIFPLNSPLVEQIKILKRHKVKRSKLYYLRKRSGKDSRLIEKNDELLEAETEGEFQQKSSQENKKADSSKEIGKEAKKEQASKKHSQKADKAKEEKSQTKDKKETQ